MTDLPKTKRPKPPNVLTKDKIEKYKHELKNMDITSEQAEEYIRALWEILVGVMSLRFGTDTTLQSGYNKPEKLAPTARNMVSFSTNQNSKPKQTASPNAVTEKESK